MAIAYKSAGTGVATEASGGDLAPTCPATVDIGDILIAHVGYEGTATTPSTPVGWALLGGPFTIESAHRHWIFGKIADGTEDGAAISFGTPAVTTMRTGRIYSFSGRVAGTITELVPSVSFAHLSHATDPQMPTVTTTLTGALAVACTFQVDDNAQASATGETGGDWVEAVAEYTQLATTPDSALHLQTCIPTADPGTVTGGTVATANDPCGVIGFEIKPSAPQLVTPPVLAHTLTTFAPKLNLSVIPPVLALTLTTFAPTALTGATITVPTVALVISTFVPKLNLSVIPPTLALSLSTFAPKLDLSIIPPTLSLTINTFAPKLDLNVIPPKASLILTTFAPKLNLSVIPPKVSLTISTFAPTIALPKLVTPGVTALALSTFAPSVTVGGGGTTITPGTLAFVLTSYAPEITQALVLRGGTSGYQNPALKGILDIEDEELLVLLE